MEHHIVVRDQNIANQKGMAPTSSIQFLLEWILTDEMDAIRPFNF